MAEKAQVGKYIAQVINNNALLSPSPGKTGAVQIFIPHLHYGFLPAQYPWAYPDRAMSSWIPEIGDYVWVWFEDEEFWQIPFYQNQVTFKMVNVNVHDKYDLFIKPVVGGISMYPFVKYIYLPNKVCIAMSSSPITPEIVIHHPQAYIIMNSLGVTLKLKPGKMLKLAGTPGPMTGGGCFSALIGGKCLYTGALITTDTIIG